MKLSNKILIGFFGFIFLYFTAALAELRFTGSRNSGDNPNSIAETEDLSGIGYIVIRDVNRGIEVIGSDRSRLEVRSLSGDNMKKLTHVVSGDTLVLSGFESEENNIKISVFVPSTLLRGITATSSVIVTMKDLQLERLSISQHAVRIQLSENKISKIQVYAENGSILDINDTYVDTLSVTVEGSQLHINKAVGLLQGSLKDNAFLFVNKLSEIQVKKDESSRMSINGYY